MISIHDRVLKRLEQQKKEFSGIWYSPISNEIILLREVRCILIRKNKPDHHYFEYADDELFGKYISLNKAMRLKFEKIGDL